MSSSRIDLKPESVQYGLTKPIDIQGPTEATKKLENDLEQFLVSVGCFEDKEQMENRAHTLSNLNEIVGEWIKDLAAEKNISKLFENVDHHREPIGYVRTFGSYRLGVNDKGADIDALCVAPRHVSREAFFESLYLRLKEEHGVTEILPVPGAYVPVIKLNYNDIDLDLTFARLAAPQISKDLTLKDSQILRNIDESSVRSLNGCRVTDELICQVPNEQTFRLALRAIKRWAKNHGVYSNSLGYLGGVSWAILVARVCQLYPNKDAATIIHKFFFVYTRWQWPRPVALKKIDAEPNLHLPVWDPKYNPHDRKDVMPILTPAYPVQNSTYNVSKSTLEVIKKEFKTSLDLMLDIIGKYKTWDTLFQPTDFFGQYKHFLVIEVSSASKDDQNKWFGLVQSRVRHFIGDIERASKQLVHLWPKECPAYDSDDNKKTNSCYLFIGLFLGMEKRDDSPTQACEKSQSDPQKQSTDNNNGTVKVELNLTDHIRKFIHETTNRANLINIWNEGMEVNVVHVKRKQLLSYLPPEEREKLSHKLSKKKENSKSTSNIAKQEVNIDKNQGNAINNVDVPEIPADILQSEDVENRDGKRKRNDNDDYDSKDAKRFKDSEDKIGTAVIVKEELVARDSVKVLDNMNPNSMSENGFEPKTMNVAISASLLPSPA